MYQVSGNSHQAFYDEHHKNLQIHFKSFQLGNFERQL